ncbi:DUF1048 domain-containing protein [Microbacterium sp.]|uniref:DUF1048 domain-containing protein n=1 Tax=Microbacterium sp. TaxID=51671 RepID=UPI0039E68D53
MNFWEQVTGSDLNKDWQAFEARAAALPQDYRQAWQQIKGGLMLHGDFTGRNLTPIFDGVLGLMETTAAEGESAKEALGDDIPGFCAALVGGDKDHRDRWNYRQRWREQLNRNVARKLSRLGD